MELANVNQVSYSSDAGNMKGDSEHIKMNDLHPETRVKRITWKCSKDRDTDEDSIAKASSSTALLDHPVKQRRSDRSRLSTSQKFDGPCTMPLLPIPRLEECCSNASIVLTGTARRGGIGPPVGAVDIGESKSAYYFRIALPGVQKDPGGFRCEIECEGKVHVHGVTITGGRTVSRYSRVFEMKTRHQCPPGPFTLSFSLPGPVDPRIFSPSFRSDGIFEAIVAKHEQ